MPRELKDNHFRDKTAREIRDGTLGSLDEGIPQTTEKSDPLDFLGEKYIKSKHGGLFGSFSSLYKQTLSSVTQTLYSGVKKAGLDSDNLPFKLESIDNASRERARVREGKRPKQKITGDVRLPKHYHYQQKYPMCTPRVLNQQMCGSCWAFSSAGMLGDRFCMHTDGQI